MHGTKESEITELRAQGLDPRAIARRLGLRPAEVSKVIRANAARRAGDPAALPALVGCFVSPGWSTGLSVDAEAGGWRDLDPDPAGGKGLVTVLVARESRRENRLTVTGYLVDTYCLGVKDAFGPRTIERAMYGAFVHRYFRAFEGARVEVPLNLARDLVLGAVEYARRLGLEPCRDFAAAAPQLGTFTGPARIGFGEHGRPHYISGPRDNVQRVTQTLERTVGDGNFHLTLVAGPDGTG
jgi:hypothetical protein